MIDLHENCQSIDKGRRQNSQHDPITDLFQAMHQHIGLYRLDAHLQFTTFKGLKQTSELLRQLNPEPGRIQAGLPNAFCPEEG
jgi:hypothetical protein